MRLGTPSLALVLVGGCAFDSGGIPGNSSSPAGEEAGDDGNSGGDDAGPGEATDDAGTGGGTSGGTYDSMLPSDGEAGGNDDESETGETVYPESCAAILAADPLAASGVYEVAPPMASVPAPIEVYCDMVIDGGGWTLVARSVPDTPIDDDLGWGSSRGLVNDMSQPYALDVVASGVEFEQVLVGDRGADMLWGGHVYRLALPPNFMNALADTEAQSLDVSTVVGDCDPSGGPTMLRYVGYTSATRNIYFRDQTGYDQYGLRAGGFDMYYNTWPFECDRGGDLDNDQGMVFVR